MAGILDNVDQRTKLVGQNRLELLMFHLGGRQRFGINVFKVQEVIKCPPLTKVPNSHPVVRGIANMRGRTITITDLAMAIGKKPLSETDESFVIIAEYNRNVQGFLVSGVDRIVNMVWKDIKPPPSGLGNNNYMTAVTQVDGNMVQIIDVEKVLVELVDYQATVSDETKAEMVDGRGVRVLVVDDSVVARKQIKRTLDQIGAEVTMAKNGREGLESLQKMVAGGESLYEQLDVVISDIEMPEMDGYTLTKEIRADDRLKHIPLILHTSLSGVFNTAMVQKVGADTFVPKFDADELAEEVKRLVTEKATAK